MPMAPAPTTTASSWSGRALVPGSITSAAPPARVHVRHDRHSRSPRRPASPQHLGQKGVRALDRSTQRWPMALGLDPWSHLLELERPAVAGINSSFDELVDAEIAVTRYGASTSRRLRWSAKDCIGELHHGDAFTRAPHSGFVVTLHPAVPEIHNDADPTLLRDIETVTKSMDERDIGAQGGLDCQAYAACLCVRDARRDRVS